MVAFLLLTLQLQGHHVPLLVWSHRPVCCSSHLQLGHVHHHHCLSLEEQKECQEEERAKTALFFHSGAIIGVWIRLGIWSPIATSSEIKKLTFSFQILFSIFIVSQRLLIFLFHVTRAPQARKQWKKLLIKLFCPTSSRSLHMSHTKPSNNAYMMLFTRQHNSTLSKGENAQEATT